MAGLPCGLGPNLACHGDVVTRMAGLPGHAVICNNGLGQLMETGELFVSPRGARPQCVFKVITILSHIIIMLTRIMMCRD